MACIIFFKDIQICFFQNKFFNYVFTLLNIEYFLYCNLILISIVFKFYLVLYCYPFYILIIQEIVAANCFISTSNKDRTCRKKMIPKHTKKLLQSLHSKTFTIVVLIMLLQGMIVSWLAISTSGARTQTSGFFVGLDFIRSKSLSRKFWKVR